MLALFFMLGIGLLFLSLVLIKLVRRLYALQRITQAAADRLAESL